MGMTICRDCGARISDSAAICQTCGGKQKKQRGLLWFVFMGTFGLIASLAALAMAARVIDVLS